MINEKEAVRISRFLSLVLRHKPEQIGLELDSSGWADVNLLIQKCNQSDIPLSLEVLKHIVETNSKKRFAFNAQQNKIRASQGHSIEVSLELKPVKPPEILYHGTAERFVPSILQAGLMKQQRQHVHLSQTIETALDVGLRHGKPVVFEVLSREMYEDKFEFYRSENGIWLTKSVPAKYLTVYVSEKK
ncbi:MAG: RNA 2'-phosphotransferase [Flavitalea sp.]